jgi:hypothetical protein
MVAVLWVFITYLLSRWVTPLEAARDWTDNRSAIPGRGQVKAQLYPHARDFQRGAMGSAALVCRAQAE